MQKSLYKDLVAFLTPFMSNVNSRQATVKSALWGKSYVAQVNYTGNAQTFTQNLLDTLWEHGQHEAIEAVLDEIHGTTGKNNQLKIEQFKARLHNRDDDDTLSGAAGRLSQSTPPTQTNISIGGSVSGGNVNIGGTQHISGDFNVDADGDSS